MQICKHCESNDTMEWNLIPVNQSGISVIRISGITITSQLRMDLIEKRCMPYIPILDYCLPRCDLIWFGSCPILHLS
jgi:hypothetical protein